MGKARSSRRMRNCKSRTKRGGTWSGNQSDLLTEFKFAVRRGVTKPSYDLFDRNPTAGVTKDVIDQIKLDLQKYSTDTTLKHFVTKSYNGLAECNADNVKLLEDQIKDESPKRKAYYLHVLDEICKIHSNPPEIVANLPRPAFGLGRQQEELPAPIPSEQPGTGVDVDPLGAPVNRVLKKAPPKLGGLRTPEGGGKSRRRHRRVRTLHKRRKSSKVRKTRYRRTHSRTRR